MPRLYLWNGRGWVPAAVVGTEWDHAMFRIYYRARHCCTAWVKRAP